MNNSRTVIIVISLSIQGCVHADICSEFLGQPNEYSEVSNLSNNYELNYHHNFTKPEDTTDMLNNARKAWCVGSPLTESLFQDTKLFIMSGASGANWAVRNPPDFHVFLVGFSNIIADIKVGKLEIPGIQYDVFRYATLQGRLAAGIRISFYHAPDDLSFGYIERLFGKSWEEFPNMSVSLHGFSREPSTDPHGYSRIRYLRDSVGTARSLTIEFQKDGRLSAADFEEETR